MNHPLRFRVARIGRVVAQHLLVTDCNRRRRNVGVFAVLLRLCCVFSQSPGEWIPHSYPLKLSLRLGRCKGSAFRLVCAQPCWEQVCSLIHTAACQGRKTGAEGVPSTQIKDVIKLEWVRQLGREESRAGQGSFPATAFLWFGKCVRGHRTKRTRLFAKLQGRMTWICSESRKCSFKET